LLKSALLKYRIEKIKSINGIQKITVRTSQLAYKFYEKQGFHSSAPFLLQINGHYIPYYTYHNLWPNSLFLFLSMSERELYFVLLLNKEIVGCGGINFTDDKTTGKISW